MRSVLMTLGVVIHAAMVYEVNYTWMIADPRKSRFFRRAHLDHSSVSHAGIFHHRRFFYAFSPQAISDARIYAEAVIAAGCSAAGGGGPAHHTPDVSSSAISRGAVAPVGPVCDGRSSENLGDRFMDFAFMVSGVLLVYSLAAAAVFRLLGRWRGAARPDLRFKTPWISSRPPRRFYCWAR